MTAVDGALQKSKKDGTPEEKATALSALKTLAKSAWHHLISAAKFD
jgi:hypothetical protein